MEDNSKEIEVIEKTIQRVKRKFQEDIPTEKKIKYLQQLDHLPISLIILKSTGVGKFVNKLRQDQDEVISQKSDHLVNKWKRLASDEKTRSPEKSYSSSSRPSSSLSKSSSRKSPTNNDESDNENEQKKDKDSSIRNNGNVSFGDALMMPVIDVNKKKKKKKKDNDLLKMPLPSRIDLPSLNDDEGSFTPEPVYKPNRTLPQINMTRPEKKPVKEAPNYNVDITSKKTRSQMYTGKKANTSGVVQSLYQTCMKVLLDNFDCLYETGGVPYALLEPLLSKCTPSQLQRFEYYNEYILDDSDILWKSHCHKEFKGSRVQQRDDEYWRDTFSRLNEEREERLQRLSNKISASQLSKLPERSTKLAYVAGSIKGWGHMKKFNDKKELKNRIDNDQRSTAEVAIPFGKIPKRDRCSRKPPTSLTSTNRDKIPMPPRRINGESSGPSRLNPTAIKKPTKKPMMAAAMKLLKNQQGRSSSQIIRR
ncbi:elongin-A-like isoform X1 [Clytia hemisphaerica]|uniref:TFIIS N-terminal domain-containing protein n=1 Tax=Clytia hemisphaerica TaxID=252671 RepID=A0A7M5UUV2_9CNID